MSQPKTVTTERRHKIGKLSDRQGYSDAPGVVHWLRQEEHDYMRAASAPQSKAESLTGENPKPAPKTTRQK